MNEARYKQVMMRLGFQHSLQAYIVFYTAYLALKDYIQTERKTEAMHIIALTGKICSHLESTTEILNPKVSLKQLILVGKKTRRFCPVMAARSTTAFSSEKC
jgi:arginine exporter protein ArgO